MTQQNQMRDNEEDAASTYSFPQSLFSYTSLPNSLWQNSEIVHIAEKQSTNSCQSLTQAIFEILIQLPFITSKEILQKLIENGTWFKDDSQYQLNEQFQKVQGCLFASKRKLFEVDLQGRWSVINRLSSENYSNVFHPPIKKKISIKQKKSQPLIRKHINKNFDDTIDKLTLIVNNLKKKSPIYSEIVRNPFKNLNHFPSKMDEKTGDLEKSFMESIKAESPNAKQERAIGILQCFYHFYPLIACSENKKMLMLTKMHEKLLRVAEKLEA